MSETKAGARPSQVTMAGGMATLGSALLVLTIFDSVSGLNSVEMRETIADFLAKPPGDGMGLSVSAALDLLRATMVVTGAVAAAATVLGVFVLQRHNAARICFTVAAAIMLLTAPVSGGVLPVLVAFSAAMLWSRPARDWFAGRAPAPADAARSGRQDAFLTQNDPPGGEQAPSSGASTSGDPWSGARSPAAPAPRPTQGFGSPGGSAPEPAVPTSYPQGGRSSSGPDYLSYPPQQPWQDKRPVSVTIAAALTWVFAGITALVYVLVIGLLLVAKDRLVTLIRDDATFQDLNVSTDELLAALWVMSAIIIVWCLAAMVLAYLAVRRHNWARIVLVVSAAMSFLLALVVFPFSLLHLAAAIATIVLLFAGGANAWFSRTGPRDVARYPQHGPPPSGEEPPTHVW